MADVMADLSVVRTVVMTVDDWAVMKVELRVAWKAVGMVASLVHLMVVEKAADLADLLVVKWGKKNS
jgi:hypothetical protein